MKYLPRAPKPANSLTAIALAISTTGLILAEPAQAGWGKGPSWKQARKDTGNVWREAVKGTIAVVNGIGTAMASGASAQRAADGGTGGETEGTGPENTKTATASPSPMEKLVGTSKPEDAFLHVKPPSSGPTIENRPPFIFVPGGGMTRRAPTDAPWADLPEQRDLPRTPAPVRGR